MTITKDEILTAISAAEVAAELALPLMGDPEFVGVAVAAGELAKKLITVQVVHAQQMATAAAKAVVDVEVDAAEAAKFPKG